MAGATHEHGSHGLLDRSEVVLVTYRSRSHVEALLASLPSSLPVVVVDNSHNADAIADLTNAHPNVRYVDGGGQGFARAANLGAFSSGEDYVVFVNPDSRPTVDDLASLVQGLDHDPGAAAHCASTSAGGDVIEIGVGGWEPTVVRTAIHAVGLHKLWPRAGLFAKPRLGESQQVDWCSGACMAVRREQFTELGGFDETFYVYAEDISFGRAARRAGLRTVLREDVVIPHVSGSSGAPSLEMLRLRGASFAHYVLRYHSTAAGWAMRLLLAAGSIARAVVRRAKGDTEGARLFRAFASGLLTRTATVNGVEVARARYDEVSRLLA